MAMVSAPKCSQPGLSGAAGILQPDDHIARSDHGLRAVMPGVCRLANWIDQ